MNPAWIAGLGGGLLIGISAAIFLLMNGRIMGASGILGGLVDGSGRSNRAERIAFIGGLMALPAVLVALGVGAPAAPVAGTAGLIIAGLLVGFGTRLGNGCTSGHGVCGISRPAPRGIVSTISYLLAGGVGVLIARAMGWAL